MWRSKKFIVIALMAAVVLVGSIGGVVLAQMEDGDETEPETKCQALLDRIGEIYQEKTGVAINQEAIKDAFAQAQSEIRDEALDRYLQNLVDEGRINEEEARQYKEWWRARPDMEPFRQQLREWEQARPDVPPELKDWLQSRPDIPLPMPHQHNLPFRGFHGGPCGPLGFDEPPDIQ